MLIPRPTPFVVELQFGGGIELTVGEVAERLDIAQSTASE